MLACKAKCGGGSRHAHSQLAAVLRRESSKSTDSLPSRPVRKLLVPLPGLSLCGYHTGVMTEDQHVQANKMSVTYYSLFGNL